MRQYEVEIKPVRLGWEFTVSCDKPWYRAYAIVPRPTEAWARRAAERRIRLHARTLRKRGPEYKYPVEVRDAGSDDRDGS